MKDFNFKNITSAEEIVEFEKVSSSVSNKYVPIYSTSIINELEPKFKFVKAGKYNKRTSAHFIEMSKGTDISLYIENSFDRTLSLRTSFKYKNFTYGFVRQIHKGESAQQISEDYTSIYDLYNKATNLVVSLSAISFDKEEKYEIFKLLLETRSISLGRVVNIDRYIDIECSAMAYIDYVLNLFYHEGIELIGKKGIRISKPIKNEFTKIWLSKKLYSWIYTNHPELTI